MRFYKEATGTDFQSAEFHYEQSIPLSVRSQFNNQPSQMARAAKAWREHSGISLHDAVETLKEYRAFKSAFHDFLTGKKVYTDY